MRTYAGEEGRAARSIPAHGVVHLMWFASAMPLRNKLGTKLRLALLGTAIFSILAFTLASVPVLMSVIREDRIKLFVEQSTRVLAGAVSHHLWQYARRVQESSTSLALLRGTQADELRVLNNAARESVPNLLERGVLDLLAIVSRDGIILHAHTSDRWGRPLNSMPLWGRHISEFPEEEHAFLGAGTGLGKTDRYRSKMLARIAPPASDAYLARQ